MSCLSATYSIVSAVVSSMTCQLSHGAASTKEGTKAIFTAGALRLGDGITSTGVHSCLAERIKGPHRKEDVSYTAQHGDEGRNGVDIEGHGVEFEHGGVHNVHKDENQADEKGVLGRNQRTGISKPRQLQSHHDLSHQNLRAADGAPE